METQSAKIVYEKPRLYAEAAVKKGQKWFEYEDMDLDFEDIENYEVVRKLGRGKYSDVFEAVNIRRDTKCVAKVLKPIRSSKIKRQIKILKNLSGGPNIIKMQGLVRDATSKTISLICEYVENTDYKKLYASMTEPELQHYTYEVLKCLDFSHSNGIIHRDIKPQNIMFDSSSKSLRVIDWGLAEFYFPGKQYNVRVASRYFKGPELLIGYQYYDYSLDIWSLGVLFASIIFRRDPFFMGSSNEDQLDKIAQVMGTKQLFDYAKKYSVKISHAVDSLLGRHTKKPLNQFVNEDNKHLSTPLAIDLLSKMLIYDHAQRILPSEAMKHPYFAGLH